MHRTGGTARLIGALASLAIVAGCVAGPATDSPGASATAEASIATASPSVASVAPASPTPESSSALPSVSFTPSGWTLVTGQAAVGGVQLQDVAWTGTRFVALGAALDGTWVFLDSPDGRSWHRQLGGSASVMLTRLAAGPGGLVAIGTVDGRPTSWYSSDGMAWTAGLVGFPFTAAKNATVTVTDVVALGDRWVAVGREDPFCNLNCGLDPLRALAWTSPDGLHWTAADDSNLAGGAMTAVDRGGPGLVAAGAALGSAAIWTSVDGQSWARVPDAPMFHRRPGSDSSFWTAATGVASWQRVVVAVGMDAAPGGGGGSVRAWWSTDGTAWSEATGDRFANGQAFSVASTTTGFLAVGPSGEQSCLGGIWASTDGRGWTCVAMDPVLAGFGPYAAAASSSVEVVVGLTSVGAGDVGLPGAAAWRAVP